jgi:polyhydroxybutyrate depolymerase
MMPNRKRYALLLAVLSAAAACGSGANDAVTDPTRDGVSTGTGGTTAPDGGLGYGTGGTRAAAEASTGAGGSKVTSDGAAPASGSTGCGTAPPTAGGAIEQNGTYFAKSTITVDGATYDYALFVPKSYDPGTPTNLVINWHGANWQGDWDRGGFAWNMEYTFKAVFVYPTAQGGHWDTSAGSRDVKLFDALSEMAFSTYCINPQRVFVIGFSNGGFMTNTLACVRGDKIRGAAPESGGGPSGTCKGPMAWIGTHGTLDSTVKLSSGEGSRDYWVAENGCDPTPVPYNPQPKPGGGKDLPPTCEKYEGCKAGAPLSWCTFEGGHDYQAWTHTVAGQFFDALP